MSLRHHPSHNHKDLSRDKLQIFEESVCSSHSSVTEERFVVDICPGTVSCFIMTKTKTNAKYAPRHLHENTNPNDINVRNEIILEVTL